MKYKLFFTSIILTKPNNTVLKYPHLFNKNKNKIFVTLYMSHPVCVM